MLLRSGFCSKQLVGYFSFVVGFEFYVGILCRYYKNWCGHGLQYLDDGKCAKKFPTKFSRDWQCEVAHEKDIPAGFQADGPLANVQVDTTSLANFVTDPDVNLCFILTKRVANTSAPSGYTLYNRYFCAGDYSANDAFETWSSSKIFAMANAAGHLRSNESQCGSGNTHNALFGLDGTVTGKHGVTPVGDLATVVCSYDTTAGYSSNSLSSYFHDFGWRSRIHDLLSTWLWKGGSSGSQTLGGNYGEATPSDLKYTVATTSVTADSCAADKDPWPVVYSNTISALSAVEMTRRIAMYREIAPELRFPGTTWSDMQQILYGAETSTLFPGEAWGGMTSDTAIFLQLTNGMTSVLNDETAHQNMWRIFSKLGAGYSTSRYRGEIVTNVYTCIPQYDAVTGEPSVGGYEFTLTARGSVSKDSSLTQVEQKVYTAVNQAVAYVMKYY